MSPDADRTPLQCCGSRQGRIRPASTPMLSKLKAAQHYEQLPWFILQQIFNKDTLKRNKKPAQRNLNRNGTHTRDRWCSPAPREERGGLGRDGCDRHRLWSGQGTGSTLRPDATWQNKIKSTVWRDFCACNPIPSAELLPSALPAPLLRSGCCQLIHWSSLGGEKKRKIKNNPLCPINISNIILINNWGLNAESTAPGSSLHPPSRSWWSQTQWQRHHTWGGLTQRLLHVIPVPSTERQLRADLSAG